MLSIRDIISTINGYIAEALPTASEVYGVAYTASRGTELLPVIDQKYIGIDNTYPVQLYHKIGGVSITQKQGTGYGDDQSNTVNTYTNSMVVFNNQKRTKMNPDELALLIQSVFPKILKSKHFISIRPLMTSVVLNSQQVYGEEYKSDTFKLSEQESLIRINYSVEVVFNGCLVLCPEDLQCKN